MKRVLRLTVVALAAVVLGATWVAAAPAATTVTKVQRELVIVSPDLSQGGAIERGLYDVIEWGGVGLGTATLGPRYRTVHILKGGAATRNAFVNTLRDITARTGNRAVDVIFLTHGVEDEVLLADDRVPVASLRTLIRLRLSQGQRAKLRMMFSTACFGASHRAAWQSAGFKMVSGSRLIYADSAATYAPFLTAWVSGASFGLSVAAANVAGSTSPWDGIASAWLLTKSHPDWNRVDSFRLTAGNTALSIGTMP